MRGFRVNAVPRQPPVVIPPFTPPAVLSSPTPSGTLPTQTTATVGATSNQPVGSFYAVVDTPANLAGITATQIIAGQNATGAAALTAGFTSVISSSPSIAFNGLTLGTSYGYACVQTNINGTSNIAAGSFITAAAGQVFAPNYPSVSAGMTPLVTPRQWNPTDPSIPGGVLPPLSLSGTDSFDMQWYSGGGPVPLIAAPASLSTSIGSIVPALPDGNPTAMVIKYPSGFPAGNLPFGCFKNTSPTRNRMYLCCYFLLPVSFNSSGNNIKWVFFQQDGNANHVFMLSSGGPGGYVGPWMALQGGGGSFNVGGNNNTKSGWITRLTTPSVVADGQWHTSEWFVQRETVPGVSGDGVFMSWIDGVLNNNFANINYNAPTGNSNGFQSCSFEPYYGGGGSAASANEYIGLGRFFAASGN